MSTCADAGLIKEGFRRAEAITRRCAGTFYFASRFLPADKRRAVCAVYAIGRLSDAAIDDAPDSPDAHLDLERTRSVLALAYSTSDIKDPVLLAFRQAIVRYDIPREYFDDLLDGMKMDLEKKRYNNFQELYLYCYRVAGVVSLIMLKICGATHLRATHHAVDLGVAMRLTNILRDIREDFERGRLYLPSEELQAHGITEKDIADGCVDRRFVALMKHQIQRCRDYYASARPGYALIKDPRSRQVARVMAALTSRLLNKIEQNAYNVFRRRAAVPLAEKLLDALKTLLGKDA
jgi:phytoene synthase